MGQSGNSMRDKYFGLGVGLAFAAAFVFVLGVLKAAGKRIPDDAWGIGFGGAALAMLSAWVLSAARGPRR